MPNSMIPMPRITACLQRSCEKGRAPPATSDSLGHLPEWNLTDLYPGMDSPEFARGPRARPRPSARPSRRPIAASSRPSLTGQQPEQALLRGHPPLRGARGPARPHHLLCRPRLCRRHDRPAARQVLRRRAGAAHGGLVRPAVLPARAEPPRRRARSTPLAATAPLAHYRPWLEDIRKEKPYQLDDQHRAALPREVGHRPRRLEPAVRRDDLVAALQGRRRGADARAHAQHAAGRRRRGPPGRPRRRWRRR